MTDDPEPTPKGVSGLLRWLAGVITGFTILIATVGPLREAWCKNIGLFCSSQQPDTSINEKKETSVTTAQEKTIPPDFMIGLWEVVQSEGNYSRAFTTDYLPDGTFSGYWTWFPGRIGTKEPYAGTWKIASISRDKFTLELTYLKGPAEWKNYPTCPSFPCRWSGTFKVIDRDHAQNINDNYVASRKE